MCFIKPFGVYHSGRNYYYPTLGNFFTSSLYKIIYQNMNWQSKCQIYWTKFFSRKIKTLFISILKTDKQLYHYFHQIVFWWMGCKEIQHSAFSTLSQLIFRIEWKRIEGIMLLHYDTPLQHTVTGSRGHFIPKCANKDDV